MLDLKTLDPKTTKAGKETDVMVAKWMRWPRYSALRKTCCIGHDHSGVIVIGSDGQLWSPSTNPTHAGEAMLKAEYWRAKTVTSVLNGPSITVEVGDGITNGYAEVFLVETGGNKGQAFALATSRAIAEAMKAKGGE